jgi:hypothetical protein
MIIYFDYKWTPEDRQLSIQGPNDNTSYTWVNGALTLEEITGVTNKAYTYYDDYPLLKTITTGTTAPYRTQTFERERNLWISKETATDGTSTLVNTFTTRDAYGMALFTESTLDGASQLAIRTQRTPEVALALPTLPTTVPRCSRPLNTITKTAIHRILRLRGQMGRWKHYSTTALGTRSLF